MKKTICRWLCLVMLTMLAILCLPGRAQSDKQSEIQKISYAVSAGIGVPINSPAATPVVIQGIVYCNVGARWALGIGTGVSFYDKTTLVPLYADVHFGLTRPRIFTPYLSCAAGYSFAPAKNVNGGFLLSPAVGVQWKLKPRLKVNLALGYELQELNRLKSYADPNFGYEFREQLSHNSLMIKAGVIF